MHLKIQCILVFLTFYVQEGLSRDYEANLGANILLQVYFPFTFFFFFFIFVSKVIEGNSSCYFLKQTPLFKQAESMYSKIQNFIFYIRIAAPQQHLSHTYLVTVSLKNAVSERTLNISMK